MPNIKKIVVKYLRRITLFMVAAILIAAFAAQILNEQRQARESSAIQCNPSVLKSVDELKKISEMISSVNLYDCVAARQGGDEFVLLLYHYKQASGNGKVQMFLR